MHDEVVWLSGDKALREYAKAQKGKANAKEPEKFTDKPKQKRKSKSKASVVKEPVKYEEGEAK